jgi:protein gp37
MGKTPIEWTDQSWPVINGCRRVSAGCENCYAERLTATRLSQTPKYKGLAVFGKNGPRWTGEARLWLSHLDMPLKLKKPSRIFVCDMGDLFYEGVSDDTIAAVFGVMAACPQHTFQVLTKRPARAREWFRWVEEQAKGRHRIPAIIEHAACILSGLGGNADQLRRASNKLGFGQSSGWPIPWVWLGTSVEDQSTADERIPLLLDTPAALRFVSAEPLLGPVTIQPGHLGGIGHLASTFGNPLINWVIVGGESGPGARPFDVAWGHALVDQCAAAGAPCFVKQLGAKPLGQRLKDRKGGDPSEWPADLRVRQFPQQGAAR